MDKLSLDLISLIQDRTTFKPKNREELNHAVKSLYDPVVSNQKYGHISYWNVKSVTNMRCMFHGATVFNQDISRWDVSNVTNMVYMFNSASVFN